jgi:hypothetical protein
MGEGINSIAYAPESPDRLPNSMSARIEEAEWEEEREREPEEGEETERGFMLVCSEGRSWRFCCFLRSLVLLKLALCHGSVKGGGATTDLNSSWRIFSMRFKSERMFSKKCSASVGVRRPVADISRTYSFCLFKIIVAAWRVTIFWTIVELISKRWLLASSTCPSPEEEEGGGVMERRERRSRPTAETL